MEGFKHSRFVTSGTQQATWRASVSLGSIVLHTDKHGERACAESPRTGPVRDILGPIHVCTQAMPVSYAQSPLCPQ